MAEDSSEKFYFDSEAAQLALDFFPDAIVHVKGRLAGSPFRLLPWQSEIVSQIFGWKRADGTRRYRRCYVEVPRKNGKSSWAAALAVYLLLFSEESSGELYSAASTRDQASLVFGIAAEMIRANPELNSMCKIRDSTRRILVPRTSSVYRAIPSDSSSAHGFNASVVIVDELHALPNRLLFDALSTSTGARSEPILLSITTAGYDLTSVCYEQRQYARGCLDGTITDDSFLPIIHTSDGDWRKPSTWRESNPSLGHTITEEYIREQCHRAEQQPSFENSFRRLHLNQWTSTQNRAIRLDQWDRCEVDRPEGYYDGRPCYIGLDFSSSRDLTAISCVFPKDDEGASLLGWYFMPEEAINSRAGQDQVLLRRYADSGSVRVTSGNTISIREVCEFILELMDRYKVLQIGFDPWNSAGHVQFLSSSGVPRELMLGMRQTFATYNLPFNTLLNWLSEPGLFEHDGNPCLRWQVSNVVAKTDSSGCIRPDKGRSAEKIDGVCSLLMAICLSLQHQTKVESYTSENPGVVLI